MLILHVLDHHWRYNGMVHAAVDLACAQAEQGHQVVMCSLSKEGLFAGLLAAHGVELIELPSKSNPMMNLIPLWSQVRRKKPDVIHAHMTKSAVLAFCVSRLTGVPLVTCVQNSFSKYASLMKLGDLVITGCKAVAEDMAMRGVPRRKLRPILNGTIGRARGRHEGNEPPTISFQHPAVVTFCGMHWRKGVPDLIAGFQMARKTHPEMHLYLFGEGPERDAFKQLVNADNTLNVTFCEPVPNAAPYLRAADVFVLASIADPAPLVICEAREAGLAIIATRVDGIPELLEGGSAGMLVKPHAPEEIAARLVDLFSDAETLQLWRSKSQYRIDRLTVSRVAEESVQVYREVMPQVTSDRTPVPSR